MIRSKESEMIIYRWSLTEEMGIQAFTAAGLNTALHAPAKESHQKIIRNRALLSRAVNADPEGWICANQIHSANSKCVTASERGRGSLSAEDALEDTDALILCDPGLQGMIFTADCLPVILYDREQKTGALIHAGWRGLAAGIVTNVLEKMIKNRGCDANDILAVTGPAIDSCCYQVDLPVYGAVTTAFPETASAFTADGRDHWRLSLEQAVYRQLELRGIRKENCEKSGLCSCCEKDLFSWRREGAEAGRMASCLCT